MRRFKLGKRWVGPSEPPFVIAEMSGNHNGSLRRAMEIVDAAAAAGADAVKFQTYTADTMTVNFRKKEFKVRDPKSPWADRYLHDLYREAATPWKWHAPLFERCRRCGVVPFSTPFDATAVRFLSSLRVSAFKIASFENVDLPLIRAVARTGKPLFLSTGMATLVEVGEAVEAARGAGARDIVLLKCTSAYPAPAGEAHLRTLPNLRDSFDCPVGVSDHTVGNAVSVVAVGLGACVVERHLTLARAEGGVDASFSLEPQELKSLVRDVRTGWESLGRVHYGPTEREKSSLAFRRSLYVVGDLKKGDRLTLKNLRGLRPNRGLAPRFLDVVLGRPVNRDVAKGTPLSWNLLK